MLSPYHFKFWQIGYILDRKVDMVNAVASIQNSGEALNSLSSTSFGISCTIRNYHRES